MKWPTGALMQEVAMEHALNAFVAKSEAGSLNPGKASTRSLSSRSLLLLFRRQQSSWSGEKDPAQPATKPALRRKDSGSGRQKDHTISSPDSSLKKEKPLVRFHFSDGTPGPARRRKFSLVRSMSGGRLQYVKAIRPKSQKIQGGKNTCPERGPEDGSMSPRPPRKVPLPTLMKIESGEMISAAI